MLDYFYLFIITSFIVLCLVVFYCITVYFILINDLFITLLQHFGNGN